MSFRPVNFSAGPAILPVEVMAEAARGVLALDGVGLSILEISHRSKEFEAILAQTEAALRRLLVVPDTHAILFLQGGAYGQFAQVPLNFLKPGQTAAYISTGNWSEGAEKEAKSLGTTVRAASGEGNKYTELPDLADLKLPADCAYVHTTSNNTIRGTQWPVLPDFPGHRHVCDMSSDILSRPVDVSRFGLIYAGAQKNAGPAGVTMVIVNKEWVGQGRQDIPSVWRYKTQMDAGSMFNTPPTFAIFCVGLVARWLESLGGLSSMEQINKQKAALLYNALQESDGYYRLPVPKAEERSLMNVVWRMSSEDLENKFIAAAEAAGLQNLKGHRSVGGLRASIYNAMPIAGVERLVEFLADFRKSH